MRPVITSGYINREKLADEVERVIKRLGPEVVRSFYQRRLDNCTEAEDRSPSVRPVTGQSPYSRLTTMQLTGLRPKRLGRFPTAASAFSIKHAKIAQDYLVSLPHQAAYLKTAHPPHRVS